MDWQIKKKAFTQYDFDYLQKKTLQREERSVFGDVVMALTSLNEIQREREGWGRGALILPMQFVKKHLGSPHLFASDRIYTGWSHFIKPRFLTMHWFCVVQIKTTVTPHFVQNFRLS